ncbi:MAG: hypothetical protein R3C56_26830 [Pirellulaceae bacterium]
MPGIIHAVYIILKR